MADGAATPVSNVPGYLGLPVDRRLAGRMVNNLSRGGQVQEGVGVVQKAGGGGGVYTDELRCAPGIGCLAHTAKRSRSIVRNARRIEPMRGCR